VIEETMESTADRGIIVTAVGSEETTPNEHVNFSLAQLDPDAAEPLPKPFTVTAHPLGAG
jgi:hypothetical protein